MLSEYNAIKLKVDSIENNQIILNKTIEYLKGYSHVQVQPTNLYRYGQRKQKKDGTAKSRQTEF
jgi:hypothetical protein